MKKPFFVMVAILAAISCCYSQATDSLTSTSDNIKAVGGDVTTELNVNLFQGNLNLNNALQQIKVRYFVKENVALRIGVNANSIKNDNDINSPYGNNAFKYESHRKTFTYSLNAGIEKHFHGTKRLSPYIGAELSLVSKSSSQKYSDLDTKTTIEGAWQSGSVNGSSSYSERAFIKYGMNLICGFDYYFAKNFYVGYEFLFQFNTTNYKDIDITVTSTTPSQSPNPSPTNYPNYDDKESFAGPTLINGIRLGFIF